MLPRSIQRVRRWHWNCSRLNCDSLWVCSVLSLCAVCACARSKYEKMRHHRINGTDTPRGCAIFARLFLSALVLLTVAFVVVIVVVGNQARGASCGSLGKRGEVRDKEVRNERNMTEINKANKERTKTQQIERERKGEGGSEREREST